MGHIDFFFFLDNFWHLGEEGLFSGEGDLFTIVVTIDISTSSSSFFPLFYLSISIVLLSNYQIPIFVIDDLPNSLFSSLTKCIKICLITLDKLQITSLKFKSIWILHHEISNFGFYHLNFETVWILHQMFQNLNFTL